MKRLLFSLGTFTLISLTACGSRLDSLDQIPLDDQQVQIQSVAVNPQPITPQYPISPISQAKVKAFITQASTLGVKLNDSQLKTICLQRHLKTSGIFAPRPAENLTSDQNLDVHYNKHKSQFPMIKSKQDYLQSAIGFLGRQTPTTGYYFDITSFAKGYQSNVVKFDTRTRELSAVRSDGAITTYYISDSLKPNRFIPVPEEFYY